MRDCRSGSCWARQKARISKMPGRTEHRKAEPSTSVKSAADAILGILLLIRELG
jgi:hypothetical protein